MTEYLKCISDKVCEILDYLKAPVAKQTVSVEDCIGSTNDVLVDEVNAVWLLNQDHYSVETVYDVATAVIGGTVSGTISGSQFTAGFANVTILNDVINGFLVDFGTGYTDIIAPSATSIQDFAGQPAGKYEIKPYAILRSGNILLLGGIELNWNGTTLTLISTLPAAVNRSYPVLVETYKQRYCENVAVGSGWLATGINYNPVGTRSYTLPIIRDERFSEADVTLAGSTATLPIVVAAENSSPNRITVAQAINITTVTNPTFTGARDVTVYNGKNVTIAFEYTTTVNGTFHRINVPANSTWSNTLKRDDYTNEGTYVSGRVITAYAATLAAGEININWTT